MNKGLLLGLLFGGLVVAGGAGTWYVTQKDSNDSAAGDTVAQQANEDGAERHSSIQELAELGDTITCSYHDTDEANTVNQGVVYFDAGHMRGDFTLIADDVTTTSHMIRLDDTQYVWQDGESEGYQLAISSLEVDAEAEADDTGVDTSKEQDFDCQDWVADATKFDLPAGVTFVDYSDVLNQVQGQIDETQSVCSEIEDPKVQAACLEATSAN